MLCMSIHGVRMLTEPVFYRGRHGQESEKGKEDREGSHQEGGKEDFKEKEVVQAKKTFSTLSANTGYSHPDERVRNADCTDKWKDQT